MAKRRWATTEGRYEAGLGAYGMAAATDPEPPDTASDWRLVGVTSFAWKDEVRLLFAWEATTAGEP